MDKPDLEEFLRAAVDTMYGDGQDPETYNKLHGATADEILSHFDNEGYSEDDFINAMDNYYSDEEEVEDTEEPAMGAEPLSTTEDKDTDGDGEVDRTEVDVDGDGEIDGVHIEADDPKELKSALNDPHAASTPEEEEMYKTIFKKNAKDKDRKFEPETPEEDEMLKISSSITDALKDNRF